MSINDAPLSHSVEEEHRRLIAMRANLSAPKYFLSPLAGAVARLMTEKLADVVSIRDLGGSGDGDGLGGGTDDSAILQAMFDNALITRISTGGLIYRVDTPLTITRSNLVIEGGGGFDGSNLGAGQTVISVRGVIGSGLSLSSDGAVGTESIALTDASTISVSDEIVLTTGSKYWRTTSNTPATQQLRVLSKATNTLTFNERLDYFFERSVGVNDYAPVAKKLTHVSNVHFSDVSVYGDGTTQQKGIIFSTAKDCSVSRFTSKGLDDRAIGANEFSKRITVNGGTVLDSDRTGTGYGVVWGGGVEDCVAYNVHSYNSRHPVTMGGESGLTRRCKAVDCYGHQCLAGFDMHPATDLCELVRCHAALSNTGASSDDGLSIQGNRFKVIECSVNGSPRHGVFTQFLVDNLCGAESWGEVDCEVNGTTQKGIYVSLKSSINFGSLDVKGTVRNAGQQSFYSEVNGTTAEKLHVNLDAENASSSHQVAQLIVTDASGDEIKDLKFTGRYIQSGTSTNVIEINGDSGNNLESVSVIDAYISGGSHAVRTLDCDYVLVDQVRYKGQGTAFTSLSGSNNVTGSNVALP